MPRIASWPVIPEKQIPAMPRFFFHVTTPTTVHRDCHGFILPDANAAFEEARVLADDLGEPSPDGTGDGWRGCTLTVVEESGKEVTRIVIGGAPMKIAC